MTEQDIDRIMQMAWEDRTPFEAIQQQFGISESEVIGLMRSTIKKNSFMMWRERVNGRKTKHGYLREEEVDRFKSNRQRIVSRNKISKRF